MSRFQLCSGIALMHNDSWVTVPFAPNSSLQFGAQNEILAQHENQLLSYPIVLDSEHPTWGRTIPVGVFLLDIPIGWVVTAQAADGETALSDNIIKTTLTDPEGETCTMRSIYLGTMPSPPERRTNRRGQSQTIARTDDLVVVSEGDRVDIAEIDCTDPANAEKMADHIWSQYLPANQLISGTLPSAQPYDVLTSTHVDDVAVGVSAGIVIEPTGQPAGIGEMAIGSRSAAYRSSNSHRRCPGPTTSYRSRRWLPTNRSLSAAVGSRGAAISPRPAPAMARSKS